MKLSDLKPLHARWIVEMFDYLNQQNESIVNGFDKAGITELKTRSLRNEKINNCKFYDSLLFTEKILFKRISNLRIQFIFQYLLTRIKQKYGQ